MRDRQLRLLPAYKDAYIRRHLVFAICAYLGTAAFITILAVVYFKIKAWLL